MKKAHRRQALSVYYLRMAAPWVSHAHQMEARGCPWALMITVFGWTERREPCVCLVGWGVGVGVGVGGGASS